MSLRLLEVISSYVPLLKKDTLTEDIRVTLEELDKNVIPSYSSFKDHFKVNKLKNDKVKKLEQSFYKKFKGKKTNNFISDIYDKLSLVRNNLALSQEIVLKNFENTTVTEGLTAKKSSLIQIAASSSFVSRFSIDLLYYVAGLEADKDFNLSKGRIQQIEDSIMNFSICLSTIGVEQKEFIELINNVPDVVVNKDTASSLSGLFTEDQINPFGNKLMHGFQSNPIYHFRLMYAEWQVNRYKAAVEKSKILKLYLLQLELQKGNDKNPGLEKEIEYTKERIESLEYKIKKVEEDVL